VDDLLTIPRPALRARGPELGPAIAIGLVVAALFVLSALAMRTPDTVSLSVDNPTDWRAAVSVRPADADGFTGLGAVDRSSSLEFLEVPDQGGTWVVRFSYAGRSTEVEVTRDQLREDGWSIAVPSALAEELTDAGVPESVGASSGD